MRTRLFNTLVFVLLTATVFSQSSVLTSGKWYKMAVEQSGVYRISADQLKKMGLDPGKIDPRKLKIFGQEGGMLPQSNATARPDGLVELSIEVRGESDGVFNKQDFVLFYAEGPGRSSFNASKNIFFLEQNLYSDKNYYFITEGETNGKRIAEDATGSGGTLINSFRDYIVYEKDEHNELKSGREWYGERFDLTTDHTFTFNVPGISASESLVFVSDVMAQSVQASSFKVHINDQLVGEQIVPTTPTTTYGVKGRHKRDTLFTNPADIAAHHQVRQSIRYTFTRGATGRSVGYLNFFSMHFTRELALYGNQTRFRSAANLNSLSDYRITGVAGDNTIWNISNPYEPRRQAFVSEGTTARFSYPSADLKAPEFIVFNSKYLSPELIGKVENQNLRGLSTPHYLIITHPLFEQEANRLANHRSSQYNWKTEVVTPDQIYNEFSSGRQDVSAIRDFVRHLYLKSPSTLKVVLLFGKCSYDYKNRIPNNTNFVPTYESRNSLSPLETYSSDDFYGFLEEGEGDWGENNFLQNHSLDVGVGRLPVKTPAEARFVVDKLISYDNSPDRFGRWRKDIVFVADDGSNSDGFTSIHQAQANILADNIETQYPKFNTRKLFLGTYQKIVSPNGETIPKANEDLEEEFNQSLIINYTGHGSEKLWADERILTDQGIESLTNKIYPFLVTATCEFGRHDDPGEISSAERSVLKEKAGSIGLVTTARPVNSSTNFSLNAAFYDALFILNPANQLTIGEIFKHTKNNSMSGVANRNFSLLGDPAMKLASPEGTIAVDEIKTSSRSDTLKALSTVMVKGRIEDQDGQTISSFNGTLNATLFDKRTKFTTIGRNDPAFTFQQWFNPLFRGEVSVKDGTFEFDFILPRNIAYEISNGKLSLYASNVENTWDVAGASKAFKIGGSEANVSTDTKSPVLDVFMGDTTFIDGGTVSPNTTLVVRTFDESGMNISNYGIGNTMMAILDNDKDIFVLNEYYLAEKDNPRKGWIRFPIRNLEPGDHTLTVKVWDTYNNPSEKTIQFNVTAQGAFVIESFASFPNPFTTKTTFFFTHNRAGEHLEGQITILNMAGQQIKIMDFEFPSSSYEVRVAFDDLPTGKKLPPGIYFGRLQVRSLLDGRRSDRVTKLIVSN